MIQPTREQARRSSLFPTLDVEGAPFDGGPATSLPRTHEYSESERSHLHQSGTWSFPDLGILSKGPLFSSAPRYPGIPPRRVGGPPQPLEDGRVVVTRALP